MVVIRGWHLVEDVADPISPKINCEGASAGGVKNVGAIGSTRIHDLSAILGERERFVGSESAGHPLLRICGADEEGCATDQTGDLAYDQRELQPIASVNSV